MANQGDDSIFGNRKDLDFLEKSDIIEDESLFDFKDIEKEVEDLWEEEKEIVTKYVAPFFKNEEKKTNELLHCNKCGLIDSAENRVYLIELRYSIFVPRCTKCFIETVEEMKKDQRKQKKGETWKIKCYDHKQTKFLFLHQNIGVFGHRIGCDLCIQQSVEERKDIYNIYCFYCNRNDIDLYFLNIEPSKFVITCEICKERKAALEWKTATKEEKEKRPTLLKVVQKQPLYEKSKFSILGTSWD